MAKQTKNVTLSLELPVDVDPADIYIDVVSPEEDLEPTWTSRDGVTKKLSDLKVKTLKAIKKNFEKTKSDEIFAGIYEAVCAELDERNCDCD